MILATVAGASQIVPGGNPLLAQTTNLDLPGPGSLTEPEAAEVDDHFSTLVPEMFFAFAYGDEGETYALHVGTEVRPFYDEQDFVVAPQLVFAAANNTDDAWSALTGFDLQLRFYQEPIGNFDWFFEAGAGVQYVGPESYPRSGTHANFRLRAGVGTRYALDDGPDLIAGIGWLHMSNANALQPNVGHDGPMIYLGLNWDF
jgi:hypothetical protein